MQVPGINRPVAILALLLSATVLNAQKTVELSATQSVDYAMKNNVQVKNALVSVLIQVQQNREKPGADRSAGA